MYEMKGRRQCSRGRLDFVNAGQVPANAKSTQGAPHQQEDLVGALEYQVLSTAGYLSFGPIEKYMMLSVTSACARRTGAASQAFECMHNTLSHGSKT